MECVHSNTWKRMERNVIVLAEWRTVSSSDGIERIASRTLDRRSLKRRSRIGLTMVSSFERKKERIEYRILPSRGNEIDLFHLYVLIILKKKKR